MSLPLPEGPVNLEYFSTVESLRLRKFVQAHKEFYDYYKFGNNDKDKEHFIRFNSDLSNFPKANVYNLDNKVNTSHDSLVVSILALEKCDECVNEKLKSLRES
jgi:hypothetical protein